MSVTRNQTRILRGLCFRVYKTLSPESFALFTSGVQRLWLHSYATTPWPDFLVAIRNGVSDLTARLRHTEHPPTEIQSVPSLPTLPPSVGNLPIPPSYFKDHLTPPVRVPTTSPTPCLSGKRRSPPTFNPHVLDIVRDMLSLHVVEEMPRGHLPNSHIFLQTKADASKTLFICDARERNAAAPPAPHFELRSCQQLGASLSQLFPDGHIYYAKIDIQGYFYSLVLPAEAPPTIFAVTHSNGTVHHYKFLRMPFGVSEGPFVAQHLWTELQAELVALAGADAHLINIYIDDILLASGNPIMTQRLLDHCLQYIHSHNLIPSASKTSTAPTLTIECLGKYFNSSGISHPLSKTLDMVVNILVFAETRPRYIGRNGAPDVLCNHHMDKQQFQSLVGQICWVGGHHNLHLPWLLTAYRSITKSHSIIQWKTVKDLLFAAIMGAIPSNTVQIWAAPDWCAPSHTSPLYSPPVFGSTLGTTYHKHDGPCIDLGRHHTMSLREIQQRAMQPCDHCLPKTHAELEVESPLHSSIVTAEGRKWWKLSPTAPATDLRIFTDAASKAKLVGLFSPADAYGWSLNVPTHSVEQQSAEMLGVAKGIQALLHKRLARHPANGLQRTCWPLSPTNQPIGQKTILHVVSDSLTALRSILSTKTNIWSLRRSIILRHLIHTLLSVALSTGTPIHIYLSYIHTSINPADHFSRSYWPLPTRDQFLRSPLQPSAAAAVATTTTSTTSTVAATAALAPSPYVVSHTGNTYHSKYGPCFDPERHYTILRSTINQFSLLPCTYCKPVLAHKHNYGKNRYSRYLESPYVVSDTGTTYHAVSGPCFTPERHYPILRSTIKRFSLLPCTYCKPAVVQ